MVLVAATVAVGANAQVKFGVKAGLNLAQISAMTMKVGDGVAIEGETSSMKPAFFVGAHANIGFGEFFGLQPEVNFSMQGGQQDGDDNIKDKISLNYINVPILFEVKPVTNLSIFVGPQIGLNIGKTISIGGIASVDYLDYVNLAAEELTHQPKTFEFNTIDVAAVVGLQYAIMGKILISARYNIGFTPTLTSNFSGLTVSGGNNRVIQIGVGYQF